MTPAEALEAVYRIASVWDQREMSEMTVHEYRTAVEDLPREAVWLAIEQLRMSETFRPSIALLRTTAVEQEPTKRLPEGDDAWGEVKSQIQKVGLLRGLENWNLPKNEDGSQPTHEPQWTHPAIEEVVESMGWQELCMSENEVADRAHFMKMYDMAIMRNRREQNMTPAARALNEALAGTVKELSDGAG